MGGDQDAEVVDLATFKRRRKAEVAGKYGLRRRQAPTTDDRGPA